MDRQQSALRVVTGGGLLAGLIFSLLPARPTATATILSVVPAVDSGMPDVAVAVDSVAEDIVLGNLFAASRSAPPGRYAPPEIAGTRGEIAGGMLAAPAPDAPVMAGGFTPVLIGTAVSAPPGETRALLQLDPADQAPRLYTVGEGAGGYRVVSIEPRAVVLSGRRGRVVLRLPQEEENP